MQESNRLSLRAKFSYWMSAMDEVVHRDFADSHNSQIEGLNKRVARLEQQIKAFSSELEKQNDS
jgi:hypothetical protein